MTLYFSNPPLPSAQGWGPGYPNCQEDKIVQHPIFTGGVHKAIKELVDLLVEELKDRGYVFHDNWSWGFACRGVKSSGGSETWLPSFHSWGLALDFNAPENVFGGSASDSDLATKNRWVVDFMRQYGFLWLGPTAGDWMHFEFVGSPADAAAMTQKAREDMQLSPEQVATLKDAAALKRGVEDFLAKTEPPADADDARKKIYRALVRAANQPAA